MYKKKLRLGWYRYRVLSIGNISWYLAVLDIGWLWNSTHMWYWPKAANIIHNKSTAFVVWWHLPLCRFYKQQHQIPQTPACISTEKPCGSYVIVLHPSVRQPKGNEVGTYRRHQSTSRADRWRERGHRQSPTNQRFLLTMSVVTAQKAADGGSATEVGE